MVSKKLIFLKRNLNHASTVDSRFLLTELLVQLKQYYVRQ